MGSGCGVLPEGDHRTSRSRLTRALIVGVGSLALGIAVIFSAGSYYSWEAGMPLFHLGAALCWLGSAWGKRSLGLDLIAIGVLYTLAGWVWYLFIWGSEQYPPAPFWPCYVVMGIAGVSLASGVAIVILRRRAHVKAGTQMPAVEVRHKAGNWLLTGGLVAMCAGFLDGPFMAITPLGLVAAVVGGALLGRRALGPTLMGVGLVCGVYFLVLTFGSSSELGRSTSLVVVISICLVLAAAGAVSGAVMVYRDRRGRRSE